MIGHPDKTATYASAEQMFLAHVVHTLSPWYERIEQSADVNLLTKEEQDAGYYVKHLPNALMRGAAKDRAEFYWKMWQMGVFNPNIILGLEDMNPYQGGEKYRVQSNTEVVNSDGEIDEEMNQVISLLLKRKEKGMR
jgi:phage portal protein BeeE